MTHWVIVLRVVMSIVIGGLIGIERESKHRPAGFKTHILVCLGSTVIMVLAEIMFVYYKTVYDYALDPTRLSAQVISGIGFLGAGTIIHYGVNVKGLTTAASLWTTAAIGMVIGAGQYFLAVVAFVGIYTTLYIFSRLSRNIENNPNNLELLISLANKPKVLGLIHLYFDKINAKIIDMDFLNAASDGRLES